MSTIKDIETKVSEINEFVHNFNGHAPEIRFDKGTTINGVTHKVFKVYEGGRISEELNREKYSKDLLKYLEGYYQSLQDNVRTFMQR